MMQLYDNPSQEALHLKAIKSLAAGTGLEFALVKQVYEVELSRLQADAHLTQYLLLLSCRHTRETLRDPAKPLESQLVTA